MTGTGGDTINQGDTYITGGTTTVSGGSTPTNDVSVLGGPGGPYHIEVDGRYTAATGGGLLINGAVNPVEVSILLAVQNKNLDPSDIGSGPLARTSLGAGDPTLPNHAVVGWQGVSKWRTEEPQTPTSGAWLPGLLTMGLTAPAVWTDEVPSTTPVTDATGDLNGAVRATSNTHPMLVTGVHAVLGPNKWLYKLKPIGFSGTATATSGFQCLAGFGAEYYGINLDEWSNDANYASGVNRLHTSVVDVLPTAITDGKKYLAYNDGKYVCLPVGEYLATADVTGAAWSVGGGFTHKDTGVLAFRVKLALPTAPHGTALNEEELWVFSRPNTHQGHCEVLIPATGTP